MSNVQTIGREDGRKSLLEYCRSRMPGLSWEWLDAEDLSGPHGSNDVVNVHIFADEEFGWVSHVLVLGKSVMDPEHFKYAMTAVDTAMSALQVVSEGVTGALNK